MKIQYIKVSSYESNNPYVISVCSTEQLFEYINNHIESIKEISHYITDAAGNITGVILHIYDE